MNSENLYWDCARFLIDSHGFIEAANKAAEYSRQAFSSNDMDKHLFWKFVCDHIEGPYGLASMFEPDELKELDNLTLAEDWAA